MILINQLAKQSGTPVHTIRYYVKYGLFRGKKKADVKSNNYTYYDEEVIGKLELIKDAKEIGFTLGEIKQLIEAWHSKRFSQAKKKDILLEQMEAIDEKIRQLKNMKKMIATCIKEVEEGLC
jgi:DNA-binding transcriptional MerR regulator